MKHLLFSFLTLFLTLSLPMMVYATTSSEILKSFYLSDIETAERIQSRVTAIYGVNNGLAWYGHNKVLSCDKIGKAYYSAKNSCINYQSGDAEDECIDDLPEIIPNGMYPLLYRVEIQDDDVESDPVFIMVEDSQIKGMCEFDVDKDIKGWRSEYDIEKVIGWNVFTPDYGYAYGESFNVAGSDSLSKYGLEACSKSIFSNELTEKSVRVTPVSELSFTPSDTINFSSGSSRSVYQPYLYTLIEPLKGEIKKGYELYAGSCNDNCLNQNWEVNIVAYGGKTLSLLSKDSGGQEEQLVRRFDQLPKAFILPVNFEMKQYQKRDSGTNGINLEHNIGGIEVGWIKGKILVR